MIFKIERPRCTSENDLRVYRFEKGPNDTYLALIDKLSKKGYLSRPPFSDIIKIPELEAELQVTCVFPYWIAIRKIGKIRESDQLKTVNFFDKMISDIVEKNKEGKCQ